MRKLRSTCLMDFKLLVDHDGFINSEDERIAVSKQTTALFLRPHLCNSEYCGGLVFQFKIICVPWR